MDVVEWLLESDAAIRWQVMRDLTDASEDDVTAERARVATEGWGARLLALQRQDGHWDKSTPPDSPRPRRSAGGSHCRPRGKARSFRNGPPPHGAWCC